MNVRLLSAVVLGLAVTAAIAQDASTAPPDQNQGTWQGQRMERGGAGRGMMGFGRGVMGTVTETAADNYTIKTDAGDIYTVHFSANTRIMKQRVRQRSEAGGTAPEMLKASDIKVGDVIAASGEMDANTRSVGAVFVVLLDPERVQQMRAMEANYGKTWLMGRVTAVEGMKVSIEGTLDKAPHSFVADENTQFRERREPITLADVRVGDMVRVQGAVKDGSFVAATVAVLRMSQGGMMMPRGNPPQ
jgi:hypothetical protein